MVGLGPRRRGRRGASTRTAFVSRLDAREEPPCGWVEDDAPAAPRTSERITTDALRPNA